MPEKLFTLSIISYELTIAITTNRAEIFPELERLYLPPGYKIASDILKPDKSFSVIAQESGEYILRDEQEEVFSSHDLNVLYAQLDSKIRLWLGGNVKNYLFVHAGTVGYKGQAILIPGRSMSGKTTLVHALLKAGATYYSDEYAVFDPEGMVHAYPRPLSIRGVNKTRSKWLPQEDFGKTPLPVGLVIVTSYAEDAEWKSHTITAGKAIMSLLDNSFLNPPPPEFALETLTKALENGKFYESLRADAQETANTLLKLL